MCYTCLALWLVFLLGGMFFDWGFLSALAVCIVWGVGQSVYSWWFQLIRALLIGGRLGAARALQLSAGPVQLQAPPAVYRLARAPHDAHRQGGQEAPVAARRLVESGAGDGALLYLALLECGGDQAKASARLRWEDGRLRPAWQRLAGTSR